MTLSELFKKFRCCRPAPILPTSQVQTTSFTYQLAFIQWALESVLQTVETAEERIGTLEESDAALDSRVTALEEQGGGGSAAPGLLRAYGTVATSAPGSTGNIPLFVSFSTTDKLTIDGSLGAVKIGSGVSKIKLSGGMSLMYTGSASTVGISITKGSAGGPSVASGEVYAPAGASAVIMVPLITDAISVSEGDTLYFNYNGFSGFSNVNASPKLVVEVIE